MVTSRHRWKWRKPVCQSHQTYLVFYRAPTHPSSHLSIPLLTTYYERGGTKNMGIRCAQLWLLNSLVSSILVQSCSRIPVLKRKSFLFLPTFLPRAIKIKTLTVLEILREKLWPILPSSHVSSNLKGYIEWDWGDVTSTEPCFSVAQSERTHMATLSWALCLPQEWPWRVTHNFWPHPGFQV